MTVKIRYIGLQPQKRASRVNEKFTTVWERPGDVQEVSEEEARVLLQPMYRKIWERVSDDPPPPPPPEQKQGVDDQGSAGASILDADEDPPAADDDAGEESEPEISAEDVKARLVEILTIIPKLKRSDFDAQGRPKLVSLKSLLGRDVTRLERDAAWDLAKKNSETPAAKDEESAPSSEVSPE